VPGKYSCTASRPPAGQINNFIDHAENDADAIRQFREIQRLDKWEKDHPDHGPIAVEAQLLQEQPSKVASEPGALPTSAQEAIDRAVGQTTESAAEPTPVPPVDELELLREFGLDDRQVEGLRDAKLITVDKIIDFARSGKKFGNVPGLVPDDLEIIRTAIKTMREDAK